MGSFREKFVWNLRNHLKIVVSHCELPKVTIMVHINFQVSCFPKTNLATSLLYYIKARSHFVFAASKNELRNPSIPHTMFFTIFDIDQRINLEWPFRISFTQTYLDLNRRYGWHNCWDNLLERFFVPELSYDFLKQFTRQHLFHASFQVSFDSFFLFCVLNFCLIFCLKNNRNVNTSITRTDTIR